MQHADPIALSSVLAEAKLLVEQLLAAPRCATSDIPTSQGAYLIYDKDDKSSTSVRARISSDAYVTTIAVGTRRCLPARSAGA